MVEINEIMGDILKQIAGIDENKEPYTGVCPTCRHEWPTDVTNSLKLVDDWSNIAIRCPNCGNERVFFKRKGEIVGKSGA